ncbi:Tomosyn [Handroanthus impetiginosus]|uniref:Tomosyn n=1 Tax=Handroanthus impetiginosus TaxID=429701 RepID=A0A2G9HQT8_9LAMI|nr:Tomosyn [Handroanthus impetiginosus]
MFAKRLFQKAAHRHQRHEKGWLTSDDVNLRINVHYGIPSSASILAFDPIQRLLAIGTLDGRIKVIGGDNIEGLLISPKLVPYKYLEFLWNQGFLVSITNDNDIQVWNLERRSITCSLQWESNVTAFSVISGSSFMYLGDEYGLMSVLKYDPDSGQLLRLHYQLSSGFLADVTGVSISNQQPIVGLLPQPHSLGNRLLIAYEGGLIILWDVIEAHAIVVRGDKVLQLINKVVPANDVDNNIVEGAPSDDLEDKDISALCWASSDGSILAVGYMDGDILFWNTSVDSSVKDQEDGFSHNVVKLQLSSAEKRLPVIVLHWLGNSKTNRQEGHLLVYGGDEIGCEEVVTVLSLEWSSGMEAIRCMGRVDLTLTGSFADMILIPSAGTTGNDTDAYLFVLSNPGRIHIYDSGSLSPSELQSKKELPVSAIDLPSGIPNVDPLMTVAKLFHVHGSIQAVLSTIDGMSSTLTLPGQKKWPLTGGMCNHLSFGKDEKDHRLYVAGYQDGSVRIWNATYPVFSLLCVLTNEINSEILVDSGASLTAVELCSFTLRLAVGSKCGLVQLYSLCSSNEQSFHFVSETKSEVRSSAQVQGPRREAVLDLHKTGVQALKFTNNGSKLIIGYECSRIAMLDVPSSSVTFITDSIPNSEVVSVLWKAFDLETAKNTSESAQKIPDNCTGELIFILTKDASIHVIDGKNGSMVSSRPVQLKKKSTAISLYVIESQAAVYRSVDEQQLLKDDVLRNERAPNGTDGSEKCENEGQSSVKSASAQSLKELFVLLSCKDSLRVYPAKSVVQGENKSMYKVKLPKPCCWTTVFSKDEKVCGLVVFYQTGEMEIRSLPELDVVKEFSLMSDLRWNFKANMERMFSSTENGHIALTNGYEVAFVSLLEGENDFRIPESLPNLHDEVLAAAANAAISVSSNSKRKQGTPGILGGIVKGFKGRKSNKSMHHDSSSRSNFSQLEDIFMRNPFPEPSTINDEEKAAELTIDDIEIDEPLPLASTSSHEADNNKDKDKKSEREILLDDGADTKPRLRTREEIIATYRKAGDASSAAGEARNKLLERQQKLERISRQTEDLQSGAEDFASLANELVKAMENRKWYHI